MNKVQEILYKNEKLIGTIAATLAVIMFLSLIEILLSNIRGESNIFIQPLATALNGLLWSLYAYVKKDWFLMIPNTLGLILGSMTTISAFI